MTIATDNPALLLHAWLNRQLSGDAAAWLSQALATLETDSSDRTFYKIFGFVPRKVGKEDLQLQPDDLAAADSARAGWNPNGWSIDQAARLLLLLRSTGEPEKLFARNERLFVTADMGELVTLYQGLPLYSEPDLYIKRAAEGLRTNIKSVFEAVAHRNPFPSEFFDEAAWNQMVLKALFIESSLAPMQGLDERANATLAVMLVDYAHERWAAHRKVRPDLWRCVGPFADEKGVEDLAVVLRDGSDVEKQAAALALSACPLDEAKSVLQSAPQLGEAIAAGEITWQTVMP